MKKLRNLAAVMSILSLSVFMTGCGGGDDDDDDFVPQLPQAPNTLTGRTVTIQANGEDPADYTFATQGNSFTVSQAGTIVFGGTYTYQPSANTARLELTQTGQTSPVVINVVFTSPTSGTFTATNAAGQTETGSFRDLRQTPAGGTTDGGTTTGGTTTGTTDGGTTTGTTDGGTTTGGTGGAPAGLAGRVGDFCAPDAGCENFNFTSGSAVLSDIEGTGNYTYQRTGDQTATLSVQFPSGSVYNLSLNFINDRTGTWSGTLALAGGQTITVPPGSSFTFSN